jgi:hypothetical protein
MDNGGKEWELRESRWQIVEAMGREQQSTRLDVTAHWHGRPEVSEKIKGPLKEIPDCPSLGGRACIRSNSRTWAEQRKSKRKKKHRFGFTTF